MTRHNRLQNECNTRGGTRVVFFYVSHLRPMDFNVLGYQSHPLQRYHPACGREGSFHLSLVFTLRVFTATQVQHSYNSSINGCYTAAPNDHCTVEDIRCYLYLMLLSLPDSSEYGANGYFTCGHHFSDLRHNRCGL